jgi:hypothetical protein
MTDSGRYLVRLNDQPWFTMTVLPYHSVIEAASAVAMGYQPDWVTSVTWHPL